MTAAARKRADLVLSGGGIKGVALVGAVGADRRQIRRPGVSGTSAGSIIGAIGPRHELTRSLWSAGGVQIAKNFSAATAWSREPSDGLDPPSRNRASGPRKRTRRRIVVSAAAGGSNGVRGCRSRDPHAVRHRWKIVSRHGFPRWAGVSTSGCATTSR